MQMKNYYLKELKNVSSHTCPNCGNHHSIGEWNVSTEAYFDDENITSLENADLEDIYVCPTCQCENSRKEIDEITERQYICPNCGKGHTLLQWDKVTLNDYGSPIRSLFAAPDDDYYSTCPSCKRVSTGKEVKEANGVDIYV